MLNVKSFLAVDFGAGSLKLAEFEGNEAGGLRLKQYAIKPLGAEGAQESSRDALILKTLQEVIAEKGIKSKNVNISAPGFHVFSKFVKLPAVEPGKVSQIIQYEAQQNVPFPLSEVVWDYQILGSAPSGELEVLLVAIKSEIVEGLYKATETCGLHQQIVDVSPAALCNAFRYNYGDLEDCTMLLDIGAKTSNVIFFEKGKMFSRSINLGANSITGDFATEAKLKWDVAEKIKIDEGFVSLGGAYEEPENPHQAAISKIARQFMTRLHIQVNQTMQFYRGQQGGSAPQRVFLSGGASVMPYTAQFFAEKLNVPVEYFNPLRNVQIDQGINLEELARVAHSLGEVIGLGLRGLARCPVELNLMPASTLRWQSFNQKKPYLVAAVFSLALVAWAMVLLFDNLAEVKNKALEEVKGGVGPQELKAAKFQTYWTTLQKSTNELGLVTSWVDDRYYWLDVLGEIRQALIRVEASSRIELRADAGVWIETMMTSGPLTGSAGQTFGDAALIAAPVATAADVDSGRSTRRRRSGPSVDAAAVAPSVPTGPVKLATNEVSKISVIFRAVSRTEISPDANSKIAFSVLKELKASPLFDEEGTVVSGDRAESTYTFTFPVTIKLKRPFKL